MGKAERRELVNRLTILLLHLVKWRFQSMMRGRSWRLSIEGRRTRYQGSARRQSEPGADRFQVDRTSLAPCAHRGGKGNRPRALRVFRRLAHGTRRASCTTISGQNKRRNAVVHGTPITNPSMLEALARLWGRSLRPASWRQQERQLRLTPWTAPPVGRRKPLRLWSRSPDSAGFASCAPKSPMLGNARLWGRAGPRARNSRSGILHEFRGWRRSRRLRRAPIDAF